MAINVLADTAQSSRDRDRRATWFFCIISALAVLVCAVHGLGMDTDSTAYLVSGANLAHGRGLTGIGGTPFTLLDRLCPRSYQWAYVWECQRKLLLSSSTS